MFLEVKSIDFNTICFGFKKTNREISTTGGEIMNLFFIL